MTLLIIVIVLNIAFSIATLWILFTKANKPGWAAIVPVYNYLVMLEIVGLPWWWLLLAITPCVSIAPLIMVPLQLAKVFGKETAYGIGLLLLPMIFYPMLAFGESEYIGPEQEERPRRSKRSIARSDDDEDDDIPRARKRSRIDDDRPRRRRRDEDEDEEDLPPRKRR